MCGVGKAPSPQPSTRRFRMVLAAVPFSCWWAMACASTWKGWQSSGGASRRGPTARITPASTGSFLERCTRIALFMRVSSCAPGAQALLLAGRAIVRGALPLGHRAHRRAAAPAGPALALIHVEPLTEVTGRTVGAQVVAQRRAACANRLSEHRAHAAHQPRGLRPRQAPGPPRRPDARPKQRLAGVDVADADHEVAVHEQLLDGHAAPPGGAPQVVCIESGGEGLGRKVREQPVPERIAAGVEETAETARVVEA